MRRGVEQVEEEEEGEDGRAAHSRREPYTLQAPVSCVHIVLYKEVVLTLRWKWVRIAEVRQINPFACKEQPESAKISSEEKSVSRVDVTASFPDAKTLRSRGARRLGFICCLTFQLFTRHLVHFYNFSYPST